MRSWITLVGSKCGLTKGQSLEVWNSWQASISANGSTDEWFTESTLVTRYVLSYTFVSQRSVTYAQPTSEDSWCMSILEES